MPRLKPLPDCEGPKLEAFTDDFAAHDVEFLKALWSGTAHGNVFKTKIDGKIYALKIFFEGKPELEKEWLGAAGDPALQQTIANHILPFECECRAFGRLKEVGAEHLAVQTYGYVAIHMTANMKKLLQQGMDQNEQVRTIFRDGPDHFLSGQHGRDPNSSEPIMGIVKDWLEEEEPDSCFYEFGSGANYPRMLHDLRELHRRGVVLRDVKAEQYVNGTLVDLSLAWTIPHIFGPEAGLRPAWTFMSMAAYDLWSFQTYIIDVWNAGDREECPELPAYICPVRAYPADGIYDRLRPLVHRQRPFLPIINRGMDIIDLTELPPYDPADFDWRKARLMASKKRETGASTTKSPKRVEKEVTKTVKSVKPLTRKGTKRISRPRARTGCGRAAPKRVKMLES